MSDSRIEVARNSGRYPYTYAADHLRMKVGDDYGKGPISRAAASCCLHAIAKAAGIDDKELAVKLAEEFLAENYT